MYVYMYKPLGMTLFSNLKYNALILLTALIQWESSVLLGYSVVTHLKLYTQHDNWELMCEKCCSFAV